MNRLQQWAAAATLTLTSVFTGCSSLPDETIRPTQMDLNKGIYVIQFPRGTNDEYFARGGYNFLFLKDEHWKDVRHAWYEKQVNITAQDVPTRKPDKITEDGAKIWVIDNKGVYHRLGDQKQGYIHVNLNGRNHSFLVHQTRSEPNTRSQNNFNSLIENIFE